MQGIKIKDSIIDKASVKDCLILPELKIIRILLTVGAVHEFKFEDLNEAESVFNEIVTYLAEL